MCPNQGGPEASRSMDTIDNVSIKSKLSEYSLDEKLKQTIFDKIKQDDNFDDYIIQPTTSPNFKKKKN